MKTSDDLILKQSVTWNKLSTTTGNLITDTWRYDNWKALYEVTGKVLSNNDFNTELCFQSCGDTIASEEEKGEDEND